MKILVTGAAGFIGYSVSRKLLQEGHTIIGIDNLNDYYDVSLKEARLQQLQTDENFIFEKINISKSEQVLNLFQNHSFEYVIHLAAQAGVRYSIERPFAYADSNLLGFLSILEGCRHFSPKHLIFASSSSVYGANCKVPFSVNDNADYPVSLYAATKRANELMAHSYSHLYNFPSTGLRFFTVYGPWGRPDMAYFKFVDAIVNNRPIEVYNHGNMKRDFTYIDDVVKGIVRLMLHPQEKEVGECIQSNSQALFKIYNIGNNCPVLLLDFIEAIENALGKKAEKIMKPIQPGDVYITYADIDELARDIDFQPKTLLQHGINKFISWYSDYYKI